MSGKPFGRPGLSRHDPHGDGTALVARIDTAAAGASVKDSFAGLDLTEAGFEVLFEARWIHRPAAAGTDRSPERL